MNARQVSGDIKNTLHNQLQKHIKLLSSNGVLDQFYLEEIIESKFGTDWYASIQGTASVLEYVLRVCEKHGY